MNEAQIKPAFFGARSLALALTCCVSLAACTAPKSSEQLARAPSSMIESCALCHGSTGMGIEARSAPRLPGLDAGYIERQLAAFAEGRRGAGSGDQFGPQMAVIAQSLDPAARKDAGAYYGGLAAKTAEAGSDSSAVKEPAAFQSCAACHGAKGEGSATTGAPLLRGQTAWYLERSLHLFRSGARGNAKDDVQGQSMAAAARPLSDQDITELAAYLAALDGGPG